ncbi:MAG: hypothetical protein KBB55_02600 [Candidatus Buchananbacteria bacterium]|nr:hypothetical protein [Candidatus Buchananbacteria bacterium]
MKRNLGEFNINEDAESLPDEANHALLAEINSFIDQVNLEDSEGLKEQLQELLNSRLGDENLLNDIAQVITERVEVTDVARSLIVDITDRIREDDPADEYLEILEHYLTNV